MIRALVLDVDGVLVGEKIGYNSPDPNPSVIAALSNIRRSGVPVVLATGKPHYSISAIIKGAGLSNPHITNGGSVVIDPIRNAILEKHVLPAPLVQEVLNILLQADIYTELYTADDYYISANRQDELTRLHAHVLQREPKRADSLLDIASRNDIVKIMPIVPDETHIPLVDGLLAPFADRISFAWGLHPIANPHQFCGITNRGISKKQTVSNALKMLHVSPEDTLGVGDSTSDWNYMELCGYVAAMANAQQPLKDLVAARADRGFIGGHVDENGILSVFDHFHVPPPDASA